MQVKTIRGAVIIIADSEEERAALQLQGIHSSLRRVPADGGRQNTEASVDFSMTASTN